MKVIHSMQVAVEFTTVNSSAIALIYMYVVTC